MLKNMASSSQAQQEQQQQQQQGRSFRPVRILNPSQRLALESIADTFLPVFEEDEIEQVIAQQPSCNPDVPKKSIRKVLSSSYKSDVADAIEEIFENNVLNSEEVRDFKLLLSLLSSSIGTALLCQCGPTAFTQRCRKDREALLRRLSTGALVQQRKAFNGLKRLVLSVYLTFEPSSSHDDGNTNSRMNPYWKVINYTPILDQEEEKESEAPWSEIDFEKYMLEDNSTTFDVIIVGSGAGGGVAASELSKAGYKVLVLEKGRYFAPKDAPMNEKEGMEHMYEKSALLTTSDGNIGILAGSTLGGGTTVNWGCCIPPPTHVLNEWADQHGLEQFRPSRMPPASSQKGEERSSPKNYWDELLKEHYSEQNGMASSNSKSNDHLSSLSDFEQSLVRIWNRIGASKEGVYHNASNRLLLEGCQKLGLASATTAQNFRDTESKAAGWACFGDRFGNKQGTLVTFLADAAKTGNCTFRDRAEVERVVFDDQDQEKLEPLTTTRNPRATGVIARIYTDPKNTHNKTQYQRVFLRAKRAVILSAGSLHSPCILLRSKVKNNQIGKHLHLHPVTSVTADFPHDVKVYESAPMTSVSSVNTFGPRNDGYGALMEIPSVHPGLMSACLPWKSGLDAICQLLIINSKNAIITLQRDCGSGQVRLTTSNKWWRQQWWWKRFVSLLFRTTDDYDDDVVLESPTVDYKVHPRDAKSMIATLITSSKILLAAGATSLLTLHAGAYEVNTTPAKSTITTTTNENGNHNHNNQNQASSSSSITLEEAYVSKIQSIGIQEHGTGLFSAHQMGSCRMGTSRNQSVVDGCGECWDADRLYVCDASTFPTASGVNPMITTLAISQFIATNIRRRLEEEDNMDRSRTHTTIAATATASSSIQEERAKRRQEQIRLRQKEEEKEVETKRIFFLLLAIIVVLYAVAIDTKTV